MGKEGSAPHVEETPARPRVDHEPPPDTSDLNGRTPGALLAWPTCHNMRDLGGYRTSDGGYTRWGAFIRGDSPCRLTSDGLAALAAYGVHTVVDLRTPGELESEPSPFAGRDVPRYLHRPLIAELRDFNVDDYLAGHLDMLDRGGPAIAGIMEAIATAPDGAVLFHCHAGKDRTGLIAALLLSLAGVSDETVAADYALSERYLAGYYERLLTEREWDEKQLRQLSASRSCPPETMRAILTRLHDHHGGANRYLLGAGLSPGLLDRLYRRLRA